MEKKNSWRKALASTASKLSYGSDKRRKKLDDHIKRSSRRHKPEQQERSVYISQPQQPQTNIYTSSASQLQNLGLYSTNYSHVASPFIANSNFSTAKPSSSNNPHNFPPSMLLASENIIRTAENAPKSIPAVDYNTSPPPTSGLYDVNMKKNKRKKPSYSLSSSSSIVAPLPTANILRAILPQSESLRRKGHKRFPYNFSVAKSLEDGYDKFGQLIGAYPLATMLFAISLASAAAFGLIGFTVDDNPDRMWSLSNTDFLKTKSFIENEFPATVEKFAIIAAVQEGESILTPLALRSLLQLDDDVHALPGMDALCYKIRGECVVLSVLDRLRYPQISDSSDVLAVINSNEKLKYFVPSSLTYSTMPDRLEPGEFLGGVVRNVSNPQIILNARATKLIYLMKKPSLNENYKSDQREIRLLDTWKAGFKNLAGSSRQNYLPPLTHIYVSNDARWDGGDNQQMAPYFMQPANWQQTRVVLACVGFVSVLLLLLTSRCSRVGHAFWLAVCVWVVVALVIVFALGIASAIGLPSSSLHYTLVLVVLIMLTPNMYVLCTEAAGLHYCRKPMQTKSSNSDPLSPLQARAQTLSNATGLLLRFSAVAITANTIYFLIAFIVLAFSKIAVIRSIAIYGIILDISTFIFTLLFFAPAVAIRLDCIAHWRDACFFCFSYANHDDQNTQVDVRATPFAKAYGLDRLFRRVFRSFAKIYAVVAVKVLLFLTLLTLFGLCLYWILHEGIRVDLFRPLDYTDFNTLTNQYQRAEYKLFGHSTNESSEIDSNVVAIYFTNNFDYTNKRVQLDLLHQYLYKSDSIERDSIVSWYEHFKAWLANSDKLNRTTNFAFPTSNNALSRLAYEFLGHSHFHSDVKLKFERGQLPQIAASRIWFRILSPANSSDTQNASRFFAVDKLKILTDLQTVVDELDLKSSSGVYIYSSSAPFLFLQQYMGTTFWLMLAIFLAVTAVFGWLLVQRVLAGLILVIFIGSTLLLALGVAAKVGVIFDAFASVHFFVALALDCVCATWFIYLFLTRKHDRNSSNSLSFEKQQRLKLALDGSALLFVESGCVAVAVFAILAAFTPVLALQSLLVIYAITIGAGLASCLLWLPLGLLIFSPLQPLAHATSALRHNNQLDYVSQVPRLFLRPPNFYDEHGTNSGGGDSSHLSVNTQSTEGTHSNNMLQRNSILRRSRHNNLIDFENNITKHQTQPYRHNELLQASNNKSSSVFVLKKPTTATERDSGADTTVVVDKLNSGKNLNSSSRPISRSYHALQRNLEHLSRSTSDDMSINGALEYVVDVLNAADEEEEEETRSIVCGANKPTLFKQLHQKRGTSPAAASGSNISTSAAATAMRYVGRDFQPNSHQSSSSNNNNAFVPDYSAWRNDRKNSNRVSNLYSDEQPCVASNHQHQPFRRSNTAPEQQQQQQSNEINAQRVFTARTGANERAAASTESFHYHMTDMIKILPPTRPPPLPPTLPTPSPYSQQQSPVHRKLNNRIQKLSQQRMSTLYESEDQSAMRLNSSVANNNNNNNFALQPLNRIFSYTAQEERQARESFKDGIKCLDDVIMSEGRSDGNPQSAEASARGHFEIPHLRHVVPAIPSAAAAASRALTNNQIAKRAAPNAPQTGVHQLQNIKSIPLAKSKTLHNQTLSLQSELQTKLIRRKQSIEAATTEHRSPAATVATDVISMPDVLPQDITPMTNAPNVPQTKAFMKSEDVDGHEAERSAIATRIQEARAKFGIASAT